MNKSMLATCIAIAAVISIIVSGIVLFTATQVTDSFFLTESESEITSAEDYFSSYPQIRIDISHLPEGSVIRLGGENIRGRGNAHNPITVLTEVSGGSWANLHGGTAWDTAQGDTLVITFIPPTFYVNSMDMHEYSNPRLTAHLEGDTLFFDYTIGNAHIIDMPVWGIVRQFDYFNDKGAVPEVPFWYGSSWSRSMEADIFVEIE